MKAILTLLILFTLKTSLVSQDSTNYRASHTDSLKIDLVKKSINFIKDKLNQQNFIVFSIQNKMLFISKESKNYSFFYLKEVFDFDKQENVLILDSTISENNNTILDEAFNFPCSSNLFSYSGNKHYGVAYVYFLLINHGEKCIEFNLPSTTYTKREFKYPIDEKLHLYLFNKFMGLLN